MTLCLQVLPIVQTNNVFHDSTKLNVVAIMATEYFINLKCTKITIDYSYSTQIEHDLRPKSNYQNSKDGITLVELDKWIMRIEQHIISQLLY